MNLNREELLKELDAYFENVTPGQFEADLIETGSAHLVEIIDLTKEW